MRCVCVCDPVTKMHVVRAQTKDANTEKDFPVAYFYTDDSASEYVAGVNEVLASGRGPTALKRRMDKIIVKYGASGKFRPSYRWLNEAFAIRTAVNVSTKNDLTKPAAGKYSDKHGENDERRGLCLRR